MSEENVELTLLLSDALNRRDVDAWVALWDDEGVWSPAIETLTEGRRTYRGPAEIASTSATWRASPTRHTSSGPRAMTLETKSLFWVGCP